MRTLGIRKTRTTPLHPKSDGMVERCNKTICHYLSKFVSDNQRDWDKVIAPFLLAYRSSVHESTGYTPSMLVTGREMKLPSDILHGLKPEGEQDEQGLPGYAERLRQRLGEIHEFARNHLKVSSDRMKRRCDQKATDTEFHRGDAVWLYNPKRRKGYSPKLQSSWEGPYTVIKEINDLIYRIQLSPRSKRKVVHVERLAKYSGADPPNWLTGE